MNGDAALPSAPTAPALHYCSGGADRETGAEGRGDTPRSPIAGERRMGNTHAILKTDLRSHVLCRILQLLRWILCPESTTGRA